MQEGCVSLMQMAKTSQAIGRMNEEGLLYASLLTDPTYGGVSASFATLGDVLIAEPDAHIGFAGPSVIEQTIRETLPDGFQTAGFLMEHGMLDLVETRENLGRTIRNLVDFHARIEDARRRRRRAPVEAAGDRGRGSRGGGRGPRRARPWEVVQLARELERPHTLDYVGFAFDDFVELHGDRSFRDDPAIVAGLARLGDLVVMLIGHQKGSTTGEMMERNFGMPEPDGYRKGMRLMRYAEKFGIPVVTLVDTAGAYPGIGAEERGQSNAIAESIMLQSRLKVPTVTIVTGRAAAAAPWRSRRRQGADAGELLLLRDQPRGLRDDPVQGRRRCAACRGVAANNRARPAAAGDHGRGGAGARRGRAHRPPGHRRQPQAGARVQPARAAAPGHRQAARETLRPVPQVRHPGRQPTLPPIPQEG